MEILATLQSHTRRKFPSSVAYCYESITLSRVTYNRYLRSDVAYYSRLRW